MRLIDADALRVFLDRQYQNCHGYSGNKKEVYREALRAVKSYVHSEGQIDAVPVVHGHWEKQPLRKFPEEHIDVCSICGSKALAKYNHCPNCGAKMGEVSE